MELSSIHAILFVVTIKYISAEYQPMVAFVCNKPAMYYSIGGWVRDDDQDCTKSNEETLEYCRKRFPDRNCSYVLPSLGFVRIQHWCERGHRGFCRSGISHRVMPYLCMAGSCPKPRLLPPVHCVYNRLSEHVCHREAYWRKIAEQYCTTGVEDLYGEELHHHGCGFRRSTAAKYICCHDDKYGENFLFDIDVERWTEKKLRMIKNFFANELWRFDGIYDYDGQEGSTDFDFYTDYFEETAENTTAAGDNSIVNGSVDSSRDQDNGIYIAEGNHVNVETENELRNTDILTVTPRPTTGNGVGDVDIKPVGKAKYSRSDQDQMPEITVTSLLLSEYIMVGLTAGMGLLLFSMIIILVLFLKKRKADLPEEEKNIERLK